MRKFKKVAVVENILQANAVTHTAPHHADEVFATAILSVMRETRVFRTRDTILINNIKKGDSEEVMVYDVGGEYDSERRWFDHHQKSFEECRSDGIKYSSAGLIWRQYAEEVLSRYDCPDELMKEATKVVDDSLIKGVDARDNGLTTDGMEMSVSKLISLYNPNWGEEETNPDRAFLAAVKLAQEVLDRSIRSAISVTKAKSQMAELIAASSGEVLVLPEFIAGWTEHVLRSDNPQAKKLLFCLFPDLDGGWKVQAIPPSLKEKMGKRKALPATWCGLVNEELVSQTGVAGAIFCHANGFIAGAKTKDAAMELARLAISL